MRTFKFASLARILLVPVFLIVTTAAYAGTVTVAVGDAKKYRLNNKPNVVVIGNPNVADVIIEDNRVMFIVGLSIGETSLHILDSKGGTILRQHISVTGHNGGNVTLFRGTSQTELTCQGGRCFIRPRYRVAGEPSGTGGGGQINGGGGSQLNGSGRAGDLNN